MKNGKKIRDIVYGFIELDEQEIEIINHPAFQRLRRIRQLALTDMVYPGAVHSRFEHSIGVMQMATDMYDSLISKDECRQILKDKLGLNEVGIGRYRKIIRLAALLHDIGHAPFSHSGEDLLCKLPEQHINYQHGAQKRYTHEDYSIAIIKEKFSDIIENHTLNNNNAIKVDDVTALLGDTSVKPKAINLLWKELISGQLDADRADYLLRDSMHLGVNYGLYDRNRLVSCITLGRNEVGDVILGIERKGWHIAESIILSRYQMFSQVYCHKVRRIYDYHIHNACKTILNNDGRENYPSVNELDEYLKYDDWYMYSKIINNEGGRDGKIILNRKHYKCVFDVEGHLKEDEQKALQQYKQDKEKYYIDDKISTKWYKLDKEINIIDNGKIEPLSSMSNIVNSMKDNPCQSRVYMIE
ncbi:MAG: phosphohydrolase [Selenomonadales bacterium]|nr:MAG: phosphohydrolase [Selenomonadales bacterium]